VFPQSNELTVEAFRDTTAPTVAITSPSANTTVTDAQTLNIVASASDDIGVTKVEFYKGGNLIGTDTTNTFSTTLSLKAADNGTFNITAVAYDAAGNTTTSSPVAVTVNIVHVEAYPAPVLDSAKLENGKYILNWSLPANPTGTPTGGYDIFIDGVDTNATWRATGTSQTISGLDTKVAHKFKLEARWNQANPSVFPQSNELTVEAFRDTIAPTVDITSPSANTTVTSAQTLNIVASASDDTGVTKVEFFDGGSLIGTDTTNPFSVSLPVTEGNNGTHNIAAVAYDAAGNSAKSAAVTVTVNIVVVSDPYPAPVLENVQEENGAMRLTWSMPPSSNGVPSGGYDIYVNGVDTGTVNRTTGTTTLISGLKPGTHTFQVEARWLQAEPSIVSLSSTMSGKISESNSDLGPVLAFPGAEGFGVITPAGRGGKIIKVTNLNDSGAGSLRAAVAASGARIVVFEVSGRIDLGSTLAISNPFITIAGQTAPSPGIQVTGRMLMINTHDVLIQHLRFRVGDEGKTRDGSWNSTDAVQIAGSNAYNVVIDHITANWSIDDVLDVTAGARDISILDSILAEPLNNSVHSKGAHGYISLIAYNAQRIFYARNLMGSGVSRLPLFKYCGLGIVNNLFYNTTSTEFTAAVPIPSSEPESGNVPTRASIVNNVYNNGPAGTVNEAIVLGGTPAAGSGYYVTGNTNDGGKLLRGGGSYLVGAPPINTWPTGFTAMPANTVQEYVLANVGALPADRDAVEKRLVNQVTNRTGSIVNSQNSVGGFPVYGKNTRKFDAGINPSGDDDGNGYTNVEEILFQMKKQVEGR
jgi:hypothetical protein